MKTPLILFLLTVSAGSFAQSSTLENELHEIWSQEQQQQCLKEIRKSDMYKLATQP